jgi:glyoxylase-like metal-dependent hydrolase (beta-lactamase superfamily II)
MNAEIEAFFDPATSSYSYVVSDPHSRRCAIIDPVLDYEPASGRIGHQRATRVLEYVHQRKLVPQWLLETHVHADHLSAAAYLQGLVGGKQAIGAEVVQVQAHFSRLFNLAEDPAQPFDHLLADDDTLALGDLQVQVLHTPGHTPACVSYLIGDAVFVGDTLFMPDYGTARCDFPGGDARALYRSIRRLFALPATTRLFMCHDYLTPARSEHRCQSTVAEQRAHNLHVHDGIDEEAFVRMRRARDATLSAPALMLPAVQVNMRAGRLPPVEANGRRYLKIPLSGI